MAENCIECSKEDKTNRHRLDPLILNMIYETSDNMVSLCLPRKYTSTHQDDPATLYLGIGHDYNKRLLSTEEVIKNQTEIVGRWVKRECKYEIQLELLVSTERNPNAFIRNKIFCSELGVVMETIAFGETALLKLHPELGRTKIFVHFKSIDETYDRIEYWGRLGYWSSDKKIKGPVIMKRVCHDMDVDKRCGRCSDDDDESESMCKNKKCERKKHKRCGTCEK